MSASTTPTTVAATTFTTGPFAYTCAVPVDPIVAALAWHLADVLAAESSADLERAGSRRRTPLGIVEALPFRYGRTHPSRAWAADTTWSVLIVYPGGIEGEHGTDPAEVYVFPRYLFTEWEPGGDNTFELVDYLPGEFPGVLSVDLTEHGYRNRHTTYGGYRITRHPTDTLTTPDVAPTLDTHASHPR